MTILILIETKINSLLLNIFDKNYKNIKYTDK